MVLEYAWAYFCLVLAPATPVTAVQTANSVARGFSAAFESSILVVRNCASPVSGCVFLFSQVEQVDEASGNAMAEATTAVVEAILEPLRPAMVAMRAKVEVGPTSIASYPVHIICGTSKNF